MLECLLNFPDMEDNVPHPLDFQALAIAQTQDAKLQHKLQNKSVVGHSGKSSSGRKALEEMTSELDEFTGLIVSEVL